MQECVAYMRVSTEKQAEAKYKKIADVWDNINNKQKNIILKSIIEKIILVNGKVEIILKNF